MRHQQNGISKLVRTMNRSHYHGFGSPPGQPESASLRATPRLFSNLLRNVIFYLEPRMRHSSFLGVGNSMAFPRQHVCVFSNSTLSRTRKYRTLQQQNNSFGASSLLRVITTAVTLLILLSSMPTTPFSLRDNPPPAPRPSPRRGSQQMSPGRI